MNDIAFDLAGEIANPLDLVEEILQANEWHFERNNENELTVDIPGRWSSYNLYFLWQEEFGAMQMCCQFDFRLSDDQTAAMAELLMRINEKLWLGHFELPSRDRRPVFRHTAMLRGVQGGASVELIEDLVDVALAECERFYPALRMVVLDGKCANDALSAAILDPIGEA